MFIDVQQNTDEWFSLRLKKATSSNFGKIMANYGKAFGNPAIQYAQRIALERVTGVRDERGYKGVYFDDGHLYEPVAINLYEQENFVKVTNGGFNYIGELGDSPDGNVGEKGCIEIKSVIANTQWERLKKGGYDTAYKWQIQGHLWIGEKDWCDFISYCPEMPIQHQLYVFRVYKDNQMIEQMEDRIEIQFIKEVNKNVKLLR